MIDINVTFGFQVPETKHGGIGLYQCKDGYLLKGPNTTECKYGNWTGTNPSCNEVYCKFPGSIENGKVSLSEMSSTRNLYYHKYNTHLTFIKPFKGHLYSISYFRCCLLETWACMIIDPTSQK